MTEQKIARQTIEVARTKQAKGAKKEREAAQGLPQAKQKLLATKLEVGANWIDAMEGFLDTDHLISG